MTEVKIMKKIRTPEFFKKLFAATAVFFTAAGLLVYPLSAADGARLGIGYCVNILIPSLFPFMVLSTYLVKSGLSGILGKALNPVTRLLFHLPGCTGATIFMSLIGGFPVGARGIAALYDQGDIDSRQAARMLGFCVNAGPAFVISVVGASLLRNLQAGIVLFAAQVLASLLLGIFSGILSSKESREQAPQNFQPSCGSPFIFSAADAARGMMNMCVFVILFAVLSALLRESGIAQEFCRLLLRLRFPPALCGALLSVLLEVTGGCYDAAALKSGYSLFAFALGWGGLCVHFQVLSCLTKIPFSRCRFFLFQFLHGILAVVITSILFQLFPQAAPVFSSTSSPLKGGFSSSAPAAISLILLCAVLLCSLGRERVDFRRRT